LLKNIPAFSQNDIFPKFLKIKTFGSGLAPAKVALVSFIMVYDNCVISSWSVLFKIAFRLCRAALFNVMDAAWLFAS